MRILVLNAGSSSQKCSLFELGAPAPEQPREPIWHAAGPRDGLRELLSAAPRDIDAVGHRVVHGGRRYTEPVLVTPEVRRGIESLRAFAPLHNQAELEGMDAISQWLGGVPQVAIFDTAFHCRMPLPAMVYPGPYEWYERGIHRYGFHGINHEYCAQRAAHVLDRPLSTRKLVICHLGSGCSLAAVSDGASVDTTMGFTPLEGLMMATRSGSIDPGVLTYLMREQHCDAAELDEILNHRSGLLGISGVSADMRQVLAATGDCPRAQLAFDLFVYRCRAGIAAMAAALNGMDALVFTAGIGENSPQVRAAVCHGLGFLGVDLDAGSNAGARADTDLSTPQSRVRVLLVRAREEWMIARKVLAVLSPA
jgi:acetate kinase